MLPESRQVHLAEIFLSGLLERVTPPEGATSADAVQYEFVTGVRDVLLNFLADIDLTLGLAGCASLAELSRRNLVEALPPV